MREPPFAVELFRDIGDFMYAAADSLEGSTNVESAGQSRFSQPLHLAMDRGTIVLDLTHNWNRIVSTLRRAKADDPRLAIDVLRGIGDIAYAIADFLARPSNGLLDD